LNDILLGQTDNMFLKYEFDVSTTLREGKEHFKSNSLLTNQKKQKDLKKFTNQSTSIRTEAG